MHDPLRVRAFDARDRLEQDVDDLGDGERTAALELARIVGAVQELHHEVRSAGVLSVIEDAHDVVAADLRRRRRFTQETRHRDVVEHVRPEHLDGELGPEHDVLGGVDRPHPAPSHELPDPVLVRDHGAREILDARRHILDLWRYRAAGQVAAHGTTFWKELLFLEDTKTTLDTGPNAVPPEAPNVPRSLALVVVWSAEGDRTGESLLLPSGNPPPRAVFGRDEEGDADELVRVTLRRQRPGDDRNAAPLLDRYVSRAQISLERAKDRACVTNLGKRRIFVNGTAVNRADLAPGDVLEIKDRLVFVCVKRPERLTCVAPDDFAFGRPDPFGLVGESAEMWALRDRLRFVGAHSGHAIILGPSGTGKELLARAIHQSSVRGRKRLVARNAATIPATLMAAELFGTAANYPNAGMPERPGLIGEAEGSTLFLDEIAELPVELQTQLLRVLDEGGDYQRLGDAKRRTADIRLLGATNRDVEDMRVDLLARMRHRVVVPPLAQRRDDIMLLASHLLRRAATEDAQLARFVEGPPSSGRPRFAAAFASALVRHDFKANVRELDAILWAALGTSPADVVELTDAVREELARGQQHSQRPVAAVGAGDITREMLADSMTRHGGVRERVWRELGLANRFVLNRLLKKHGLDGR